MRAYQQTFDLEMEADAPPLETSSFSDAAIKVQPVNCGRCSLLSRHTRPGFGICGSTARMIQTGEALPTVSLDSTCEHAALSAKFDPDFKRRWQASLRAEWKMPSLP
jgi:hypothetical protein